MAKKIKSTIIFKTCLLALNLSLFLIIAFVPVVAQQKKGNKNEIKKQYDDKIIMNIGTEKITFNEVKKVYDKNSMKNNVSFESITRNDAMDFLDVYSKYKMKVIDGKKNGYDKEPSVIDEINRNKKILAESFLLESDVIEPNIKRFTNMRKIEKKIAVIMVNFDLNGDTTEAYKNIHNALKEIQNGATFEYAASKYSSDTASAKDGGLLPVYITGLRVQKDMENVIYKLKVGEYNKEPIKTGFGYFLIKLIEDKPREFISISHILIPFSNDNVDIGPIIKDSVEAKKLSDSIYKLIETGGAFGELARKFSSDKSNSEKNGHLGVYSRSTGLVGTNDMLIKEVENAAFSLKDKQVSKPVLTKYGYHIIKRDSTVVYPANFEADDIRNNYKRLYFQEDKMKFYDSLAKKICGYVLYEENLNALLKVVDTTKTALDTNFSKSVPNDLKQKNLYVINGKTCTIEDFVNKILDTPELKLNATNHEGLHKTIRKLIEPIVIETATVNIAKTHPQFNMIIGEYADGIVLFKAEEINVWEKLKQFDTARAKQFYDTTTLDLTRPAYYDVIEIFVMSEEKANEIYNDIATGKINFETAAAEYTQRNAYRDKQGKFGFVSAKHTLAQKAIELKTQKGQYSKPFKYENGYSIVKINDIQPERKKTFEEAFATISGPVQVEYQKQLEKNWIEKLQKEYKTTINEKLIDEIYGKKK